MNRMVRVGDIVSLQRRRVHPDPSRTYTEIGIRSFGKGLFHKEPRSGSEFGAKRVFEIYPGDLILSNVFAWEGAIAVADERDQGKIGSHRFLTYTTDRSVVAADYLKYFFLSTRGLPLIQSVSPGSAGRNRTLGIKAFEELRIPLLRIEEQQQIAARLDRVWCRRKSCADEVRRVEAKIRAIHDSLCWTEGPMYRVGDILGLVRKAVRIDLDKTYRPIGIYSFGRGIIRREPTPATDLSKLRYFEVPANALILSNIKAWEGAIAVSSNDETGFIASNRFLSYLPTTNVVDVGYLRYYFLSMRGLPQIEAASPGMADRNRTLGIDAFEDLKVPLPGIHEQRRIASQLNRIYEALRRIHARERKFDGLLTSALNAAFVDL